MSTVELNIKDKLTEYGNESVVWQVISIDIKQDIVFLAPLYKDYITNEVIQDYQKIGCWMLSDIDKYFHPVSKRDNN